MAESEEELKSLWMKVKEESENVVLKLNIQKTKIMASGPITSWKRDGETVETVSDFFGGLQNNFQMFKLLLEKAEEQRSNCQHPLDHRKNKRLPGKHLFLLY